MTQTSSSQAAKAADPSPTEASQLNAGSSAAGSADANPAAAGQPPETKTATKSAEAPEGVTVYAIVEASGQQFWLQPNRYYDMDRMAADVDSTITLENVLLVNDGKAANLGQPYVKGATVELKVLAHRRGPKLIVYKMRPKKKTRRKNGHRQELTRVMVQSISVGGKAIA